MTKKDIKMLDVVKLRGGNLCIVTKKDGKYALYDPRISLYVELLDNYSNDLINYHSIERDIVAVAKLYQITARETVPVIEFKLWIDSIREGTFYEYFRNTWTRKERKNK